MPETEEKLRLTFGNSMKCYLSLKKNTMSVTLEFLGLTSGENRNPEATLAYSLSFSEPLHF